MGNFGMFGAGSSKALQAPAQALCIERQLLTGKKSSLSCHLHAQVSRVQAKSLLTLSKREEWCPSRLWAFPGAISFSCGKVWAPSFSGPARDPTDLEPQQAAPVPGWA